MKRVYSRKNKAKAFCLVLALFLATALLVSCQESSPPATAESLDDVTSEAPSSLQMREHTVAVGYRFCLALDESGAVWAWGELEPDGRPMPPTKVMEGARAVRCFDNAAAILKEDNSLWISDGTNQSQYKQVIEKVARFIDDQNVVEMEDGRLLEYRSSGSDSWPEVELPELPETDAPQSSLDSGRIREIGSDYERPYILFENGDLYLWKRIWDGQNYVPQLQQVYHSVSNVASWRGNDVFISEDGIYLIWPATQTNAPLPQLLADEDADGQTLLHNLHRFFPAGTIGYSDLRNFYYLTVEGQLWGSGNNAFGQLGGDDQLGFANGWCEEPRLICEQVIDFAARNQSCLARLKDGSLLSWGNNDSGQRGDATSAFEAEPVPILDQVASLSLSFYPAYEGLDLQAAHSLAVREDGSLWGWGGNDRGQVSSEERLNILRPQRIGDGFKEAVAGYRSSLAVDVDGALWTWGRNSLTEEAAPIQPFSYPDEIMSETMMADAVPSGVLILDTEKRAWPWPQKNPSSETQPEPKETKVEIKDGIAFIEANLGQYLAIDLEGALWSWGWITPHWDLLAEQARGQDALPIYGTIGRDTPWRLPEPTNLVQAAAGGYPRGSAYTLALDEDGVLWGWGTNSQGELGLLDERGLIDTEDRLKPERLRDKVRFVAAGGGDALAIDTDDCLWLWGAKFGAAKSVMKNVRSAQVSNGSVLALTWDGTLWAWGNNLCGQLGTGRWAGDHEPYLIRLGE